MLRFILLLCLFGTYLIAEPSAFELQSGATKKQLKSIQSASKNLENLAIDYSTRIQVLEQSQEGLQSVLDGQALRIKNLLDLTSQQETKIQALQASLEMQNQTIATMSGEIEKLNATIKDLTALTTKLNQDILNELNALGKAESKSKETSKAKKTDKPKTFKNLSNKEIHEEAKKLYQNKKLDEAKERYEWLIQNNYKNASCLYMLGEIEYQLGRFKEAIGMYKKSVALDDKASYMPILLWHTAWSFRYSKDMENYNKFLDTLIKLYPDSEQGKKAKNLKNKS